MNVKMLHTCIRVVDLEKSIKFYKDTLGLEITREKDHLNEGFKLVYLSDSLKSFELELTYNVGAESYVIGNGYSHLALGVDDLEENHQHFKDMGHEVSAIKGLTKESSKFFFIKDPDGYLIEIIKNK
ncbi:MAG: VOC family protein [Bacilli bacterium]